MGRLNAFTAGNPFWGTILLEFSIGGVLKGLRLRVITRQHCTRTRLGSKPLGATIVRGHVRQLKQRINPFETCEGQNKTDTLLPDT